MKKVNQIQSIGALVRYGFINNKIYKVGILDNISNLRIVSMSPSNLMVAGCFYFRNFGGWNYG